MKNDLEAHLILICFCMVVGALIAPLLAHAWYYGAFLGFLVGIGIPLIGIFGIHD